MDTPQIWWIISGIALSMGILWLLISGFVGYQLMKQALPLMGETKEQIHELGDLAFHTVENTAGTLDLIEKRLTQTGGQVVEAGSGAMQQMMGIGSIVAGVSMAVKIARFLHPGTRRNRRRKRKFRLFSRR